MKAVFGRKKFKSRRNGAKNGGFGENGDPNLRCWFRDPQKALPCAEPHRLTYFLRQNRCARLGGSLSQETFFKKPKESHLHKIWRPSVKRFLGGGGEIFPFRVDFHRRPYNTLALPCECVIKNNES